MNINVSTYPYMFVDADNYTATWDNVSNNGAINNGSGTWDTTTPNWSFNNGIYNTNFLNYSNVTFGVNSGSSAGNITISGFSPSVNVITFNQTPSGNYLISGNSINIKPFVINPIIYTNKSATINSDLISTSGLTVVGNGILTLSGNNSIPKGLIIGSGTTPFASGNVQLNNFSNYLMYSAITVNKNGTLILGKSNTSTSYTYSPYVINIIGNGLSASTGLIISGGVSHNASANGIQISTAPSYIRYNGSGQSYITGYDYNENHISVASQASGSIIDSGIQIMNNEVYGVLISVVSGVNTSTGDLIIKGPLGKPQSAGYGLGIINNGSVNITSQSPSYSASSTWIYGTSTLIFSGSANLGGGVNSGTFNFPSNGKFIWSSSLYQKLSGIINGGCILTNNGTGTLELAGNNSYSGLTTLNSGITIISSFAGTGSYAGGITLNPTGKLIINASNAGSYPNDKIIIAGGGALNTSFGMVLSGSAVYNCQNNLTLTTAPTRIGYSGSSNAYFKHFDVNGVSMTIPSVCSGTIIDNGILIGNGGYGFRLNIASGTSYSTGDLVINGGLYFNSVAGFGFYLNGTGSVVINGNSPNISNNDVINVGAGFGSGTNTLIFSGSASLRGGTWGQYIDASHNTLNVNTGAKFSWNSSSNQTIAGVVSGGGNITVDAPSTFALSNSGNSFTGTITIKNGTFKLGGTSVFNTGSTFSGSIVNNGIFEYASSSSYTISSIISGSGSLLFSGGLGALILSGNNTYSGGTIVKPTNNIVAIYAGSNTCFGTGTISLYGTNQFYYQITVPNGLNIQNNITMIRGFGSSNRSTIGLGQSTTLSGNITLDNTSNNGTSFIAVGGSSTANPSIISGNINYTTLGIFSSSQPTIALRGSAYGKVSGSISLANGYLQILDSTKIELSNTLNNFRFLDLANSSAIVYCGTANTLSSNCVVSGNSGSILRLSDMSNTSAYSQTISGLSVGVKVDTGIGSANLTINNESNFTADQTISSSISLLKSGSGIQSLSGINTYTGSTTVSAGTLSFLTSMPSSPIWNIITSNISPSSSNSGLINLPSSPDFSGKTVNFIITESGTGISWVGVSYSGTSTGTPTLKVNGTTVTSGVATVGGTTVTYSTTTGITITR